MRTIGSAQATAAVSHGLLALCSEMRIKHNKLSYVTIKDQRAPLCPISAVSLEQAQCSVGVIRTVSELR